MFFIGIFGIENKQKEICEINQLQCKSCTGISGGRLYKSFKYFHFFFIPIIRWGEEYYVQCNNCKRVFKLNSEKGKSLEKGINEEISYWDLEEISNEYQNYYGENKVFCKTCGAQVENKYKYCPYCGNEI